MLLTSLTLAYLVDVNRNGGLMCIKHTITHEREAMDHSAFGKNKKQKTERVHSFKRGEGGEAAAIGGRTLSFWGIFHVSPFCHLTTSPNLSPG